MKHLYFARHGLSEMNVAGLWSGSSDTPLVDEGKIQAKSAGNGAKDHGIDLIISSPLVRAYETATIIAGQIGYPTSKIQLNDLLTERHLGKLEGQPYEPHFDRNMDDIDEVETLRDFEARVRKLWDYLQKLKVDTVLIVSHGATGRMLRHVIDPATPFWHDDKERHIKLKFPNAEIVKLV